MRRGRIGIKRAAGLAIFLGTVAVTAQRAGERDTAEAHAVTVLRSIQSGESWYAAKNAGYYDTLACLASQTACIPGSDAGPFLSPHLAADGRLGKYHFTFNAGPAPGPADTRVRSRSSITRFAVTAIPVEPDLIKRRSFCGDDTGSIYIVPEGATPAVDAGRCLDTAVPLPGRSAQP